MVRPWAAVAITAGVGSLCTLLIKCYRLPNCTYYTSVAIGALHIDSVDSPNTAVDATTAWAVLPAEIHFTLGEPFKLQIVLLIIPINPLE